MEKQELLKKALKALEQRRKDNPSEYSEYSFDAIIQEIEIHQAELEAQNSELKEKEALLEEAGIENQMLFENAPIAYLILDKDLNILRANQKARETFGVLKKTKKKIDYSFVSYVAASNFEKFFRWIDTEEYLESTLKIKMRTKDGEQMFRLFANTNPNNDTQYLLSLSNIQHEMDLYNKLEEHNELLEQKVQEQVETMREQEVTIFKQAKFASMGEMIANIAHQWRQPLNTISVVVSRLMIQSEMDRIEKRGLDESLKIIEDSIKYLSNTIDVFRKFFAPKAVSAHFDVCNCIFTVLNIVKNSFEDHQIQIDFNPPRNITIEGYEKELQQVLMNLLSNSKDALLLHHPKNKQVQIAIYELDETVKITIQDNGGGLKESIKDKIFEPYFTTKFQAQGTGIGLYMSKIIIEKTFGGRLYCSDTEDGVQFILELPKRPNEQSKQE